jgi:hemolysin III
LSEHRLAPLSAIVFALAMVALYAISTLYHIVNDPPLKAHLQRLDRAAIALLIAGTYTPVGLLMVRGLVGGALCVGEWGLAFAAFVLAVKDPDYTRHSVWLYQAMGWLTALGVLPFFQHTPVPVVTALAVGGGCYLGGVLFLVRDRIPYFHTLFHVWVLLGTVCQFWAIREFMK